MWHFWGSPQNRLCGFLLIFGVLVMNEATHAQPAAVGSAAAGSSPAGERTMQLSSDSATNSQRAALRDDLIAAITQGASPAETAALIQRQRQADRQFESELDAIRSELVAIQKRDFNRESQQRRAELRRRESLLWLTRVELAALLPEMFAEHAADSVALSEETIRLVGEALAKFPSESELNRELSRLLSEAQLRSGDADAALRTMQQASLHERRTADSPSATQTPEGTAAPLVIETSDQPAFLIRIDIAKRRWEAAEDKLQQYFGTQPAAAPPSPAMDLARLRYLIARPAQSPDLNEIGQWLDAIQTRGGATARRNAETLLARYRELNAETESALGNDRDSAQPPIDPPKLDPRVLRADARYYLRVGKTLPAAITFARAAVVDTEAARGIESAIQSAAILQSVSKESAAAELLRRIALAHRQHELSPLLMLQAAALRGEASNKVLRSESGGEVPSSPTPNGRGLLFELLAEWPTSEASLTARTTLIYGAVASGDLVAAAVLATQMPAEHWNEETAMRCRKLWQRAIVGPVPSRLPCHWDDEACHREQATGLNERLSAMRSTFAVAAAHPLAEQTGAACTILLDSCVETSNRERLEVAQQIVSVPFLAELALQRLGDRSQSSAPDQIIPDELDMRDVVMWRLNNDLRENLTLHRNLAHYLLSLVDKHEIDVDPRLHVAWLMGSGQMDQGDRLLRTTLAVSDQPADLLAAAAAALADSAQPAELIRAARLWQELAAGIPTSQPSHQRAKVESIHCLWRSGNRRDARSAAELMLLTNPPHDQKLTEQLQEWSR